MRSNSITAVKPNAETMKALTFLLFATAALGADFAPIVEVDTKFLFGAMENGKSVLAEKAVKHLHGGETFRLYSLTAALGEAKGGKPESAGEPCPDMFVVPLTRQPPDGVIAIGGKWNALPRLPKILSTKQPVYVAAVKAFLESRGLRNPAVKIEQILRIDLDGDGEEEVLISATNYFSKDGSVPNASSAGSYSCVIERRVVKGEVRTRLIEGEFYLKAKTFNAPSRYRVAAVLDVDGDGSHRRVQLLRRWRHDDLPLRRGKDHRVAQHHLRRVNGSGNPCDGLLWFESSFDLRHPLDH
jgi:hypothetical protein